MEKLTEKEIFELLKEAQEDEDVQKATQEYFVRESGKLMWLRMYFRQMQAQGITEFRIAFHDNKKGIIHPLGKDGKTFDFDFL